MIRAILLIIFAGFSTMAAEPEIKINDIRIDNRLTVPQYGKIDTTAGNEVENWTAIILDLEKYLSKRSKTGLRKGNGWILLMLNGVLCTGRPICRNILQTI